MSITRLPCFLLLGLSSFAGCGIDLADGTERVAEEEEVHMATADKECKESLTALQTQMESVFFNYTQSGWVPDDSPSKVRRKWSDGSSFDEIGWKPSGKVQGSYMIKPTTGEDYLAACKADVDEDGNYALWTVTKTTGPIQTSEEGFR